MDIDELALVSCVLFSSHSTSTPVDFVGDFYRGGEVDSLCRAQLHGEDWDPVQVAGALRC